ncbi:hypothetical protein FIBSPDRAFT_868163 [Athelia psychrophila]|uniref:Uncharacterized protein n=1 Tax=Athelia psychrophila TaxID=1759441 RepID=A0A166DAF4_9AGAM|nr:hypothetical protein FIBSPDRAFT_868163 [Fibularhizoctonia sp. CBS 109695]
MGRSHSCKPRDADDICGHTRKGVWEAGLELDLCSWVIVLLPGSSMKRLQVA